MLSHNSLKELILTNFAMMQYHGYSWTELESMVPWERNIYIGLLEKVIKDEQDKKARERG